MAGENMASEIPANQRLEPGSQSQRPELLAQLIARHAGPLELYARQWCRTAEDVVQQAFLQLARQPFWPDHAAAWLYRVVRNGAISAARSEQRRERHERTAAALSAGWFRPTEDSRLDAQAAAAALASLPLEEREVIVAHLWGGLPFEQIASLGGTSTSTAHRRYVSGLARLREKLDTPCQKTKDKKTSDRKDPPGTSRPRGT